MERKILTHDTKTGMATVRFSHGDVTVEHTLDLKAVVPGSAHAFEQMGIEFTKANQLKALDAYTKVLETHIDAGLVKNPPVEEAPAYTPPPEPPVEESGAEDKG